MDDLTTLSVLDENILINELKIRFEKNIIYTYISDIIIALNPYEYLPIYGNKEQEKYSSLNLRSELPPHIFAISDAAFENLQRTCVNQVCVVSGESGAGKTESTKQLIKHMAFLSKHHVGNLHEQIVQINPLLEAFGNAKTILNDNSSRFGKFVELSFSSYGEILGGKISEYLLEKSRIVSRGDGEKNFHIFYYLFAGLDEACLQANLLSKPENHRILSKLNGQPVFTSAKEFEDCKQEWSALLDIQRFVGFLEDEINGINALLAAVLHIGDIQFTLDEQTDGVYIENDNVIAIICQLLSIEDINLIDALILTTSSAGSEKVISLKNLIQANAGRDALAKALYGKLFSWIVHRINKLLQTSSKENQNGWVGVLDIYGFENLGFNSLEQICINLTNEQLQLFFNQYVFRFELEEYEKEGINCEMIKFTDNTALVELILETRNPPGLFAILDEESNFPQATDLSFVEKMAHNFANKNTLIQITRPQSLDFVIKHYAVNITYNAVGFLEKNRDTLSEDLINCLNKSQSMILQELLSASSDIQHSDLETSKLRKMFRTSRLLAPNSTLTATVKSKEQLKRASLRIKSNTGLNTIAIRNTAPLAKSSKTIATHFKNSLYHLVEKMFSAQPHFVRCIKTNNYKMPNSFEDALVHQQLSYTGILETVKIRKQGYPARFPFEELVKNYGIVAGIFIPNETTIMKDCHEILQKLGNDHWKLGKTKVFLKHTHLEVLNILLDQATKRVQQCQCFWRAFIAKRLFEKLGREEEKRKTQELNRIRAEEERLRKEEEERIRIIKEEDERLHKSKLEAAKVAPFTSILDEEKDKVSDLPADNLKHKEIQVPNSFGTLIPSAHYINDIKVTVLNSEESIGNVFNAPVVWDKEFTEEFDPTIFILNESMPRLCLIDSGFWGKMYIIERQTIVGKSYIFTESLIVDDSKRSYDGETFGLNHEHIPHIDDIQTSIILNNFNQGINIIVDEHRNIYVRNLGCRYVIIRGLYEQSRFCFPEGVYLNKGEIKTEKVKIFDMNRFREKIKNKLLSLDKEKISVEDAYEMARWAVCGVVFEPTSQSKMDTDYALSINLINITALSILGKDNEFKQMFSSVTNPTRYKELLNIWKTLDIQRMSPK